MYERRRVIVAVIAGLLTCFLAWATLTFLFERTATPLPAVAAIGSNFDSSTAKQAKPFNELLKKANAEKDSKIKQAQRYRISSGCMVWFGILITSAITLIAAWTGLAPPSETSPTAPPVPSTGRTERRGTKIVRIIAVLAALASVLQGIASKLESESKQKKEVALNLLEASATARKRFVEATNPTDAQAVMDTLEKALTEAE